MTESPTPDLIQQTTETVGRFIQWIAELIRRRNWFMLLVLIGVALAFLGSFFRAQINSVLPDTSEGTAWTIVWTVTVVCFLAALVVAVVTMPRPKPEAAEDTVERKAIKGLRPFTKDDAAVFARLQREISLRECCEALTSQNYKFGILTGESGCGKTSFLQAGLLPKLTEPNCSHRAVYIRFSEQEPFETVRKALAEQLEMPLDWLKESDFLQLLNQSTEAAGKPIVLLLDQFEQFFVHTPRKEKRKPFVTALTDWYQDSRLDNVKLLVSIRADLRSELDELHKALQYSLGPQDVCRLERFTPQEAAKILKVIAETERLEFDARFVTELAEQELAHRESGTISPVDLQILAWMIERQRSDELRAFNRTAFQKFGGVEGLLTRFLERTLDARVLDNQRQAAIKTLLALTDLDKQVRAGSLTLQELQTKLKDTVKPSEVEESVNWLSRSDVRLITPQDKDGDGTYGYELAHERLIPALMRLAGKELTTADKANQLLERRVNEWLGNQRNSRYLLGWRELWLIRRQRPYLVWGAKREQKEKLIRLSQRRAYGIAGILGVVLLVSSTFYIWLNFTTLGQIQWVRWALVIQRVGSSSIDYDSKINVANALIKDGQYAKGIDLIANKIQSYGSQAFALQDVAETSVKLSNIKLLRITSDVAKEIENPYFKSFALGTVAGAYSQLEESKQAQTILEQALAAINSIDDNESYFKFYALGTIARVAGQLEESKQTQTVLAQALAIANSIDDNEHYSRFSALSTIANAYSQLQEGEQAQVVLEQALAATNSIDNLSYKSSALSTIANAYSQLQEGEQAQAVLEQALAATNSIDNLSDKSFALSTVANAAGQLQESEQAQAVLEQILAITNSIDDNELYFNKFNMFSFIANAYSQLQEGEQAQAVLAQALAATNSIDNLSYKSSALSTIANAAGQLQESEQAQAVLEQILAAVNSIHDDEPSSAKFSAFSAIAIAYNQLQESEQAQAVLDQALTATNSIDNNEPFLKSSALSAIASAAGQLQESEQAQAVLEQVLAATSSIDNPSYKSEVLLAIANALSQSNSFDTNSSLLIQIRQIAEQIGASDVLSQIASYQALYGDWRAARRTLRTCSEEHKVNALAAILAHYAESEKPQLIDGPVVLAIDFFEESANQYKLSVKIQSPDENCRRYSDWWEVLSEDGELLERYFINTPNKFEEPFTTDGRLVLQSDQTIIVRAHFTDDISYSPDKYGVNRIENYSTQAMKGIVGKPDSFKSIRLPAQFAAHVENEVEQPQECQAT